MEQCTVTVQITVNRADQSIVETVITLAVNHHFNKSLGWS